MQAIICSHGFGVKADARGMFHEIANSFPDFDFVMFDYNTFDNKGNTIVSSIDEQAKTLQRVINESPDNSILLCHSQGSIIAGLVSLERIKQVILLAPPVHGSMARVIKKIMDRPGSVLSLEGVSELPRSDGTVTLLSKEYLKSIEYIEPLKLYNEIANTKPTVIVRSLNDQVLGVTYVNKVKNATVIDLPTDHDFTENGRSILISTLKSNISY